MPSVSAGIVRARLNLDRLLGPKSRDHAARPIPEWQHLALYAVGAALIIMLLQRIPYVGRIVRFAFSLGLLAFLIFILLQQAPYQPELARFTDKLGLDDQQVAGKELRVKMASDGHFWVDRLDQRREAADADRQRRDGHRDFASDRA